MILELKSSVGDVQPELPSSMVPLRMPPEPTTLVRLVMDILGAKGPTALARELGMNDYSAPRKIADWLEGKYAPNYEATMLMLERVGFLNLEANKPQKPVLPDPLTDREWYLIQAANNGSPPDRLALIFNVSEDEVTAELQQARDELARSEETRGETPVITTPSTPEEIEHLEKLLTESGAAEAFAQAGKPTLESLDSQIRGIRARIDTTEIELKTRLKNLERELRTRRTETQ